MVHENDAVMVSAAGPG